MLQESLRYGLSNYLNFQGRTQRSTFWWYVLAVFIIIILASIVDGIIFGTSASGMGMASASVQPLTTLASLFFLIPNLAMAVRRLHDIGKSGWWVLIGFVPIIGFLVLIYFYVQPSAEVS